MLDKYRSILRNLTLLGTFGALLYVLHVVLGGILWQGYNHIQQPISDLTATGAPDRVLLSRITLGYALCSITFAVCAYLYLRNSVPKVTKAGMITFLAMQLVSLSYGWFPQDLPGSDVNFAVYSIITSIILFFAGGTTAIFFANKLSGFGLFERINIGSLQLWMLVFSLTLFFDKSNVNIPADHPAL